MMEKITFYPAWFPLGKGEFAILAMLADKGGFKGNLTDICNYLSICPQTKNRNKLRESIETLTTQGFISVELKGNTYTIEVIPKENPILIPREWLHHLENETKKVRSVAWEQVLKVLLWALHNKKEVITNAEIAADLKISVSTVGDAKAVLKAYDAIRVKQISKKLAEGIFQTIGHTITPNAWWTI